MARKKERTEKEKYWMTLDEHLDEVYNERPEKLPEFCDGCDHYSVCDQSDNKNIASCTRWDPNTPMRRD